MYFVNYVWNCLKALKPFAADSAFQFPEELIYWILIRSVIHSRPIDSIKHGTSQIRQIASNSSVTSTPK